MAAVPAVPVAAAPRPAAAASGSLVAELTTSAVSVATATAFCNPIGEPTPRVRVCPPKGAPPTVVELEESGVAVTRRAKPGATPRPRRYLTSAAPLYRHLSRLSACLGCPACAGALLEGPHWMLEELK